MSLQSSGDSGLREVDSPEEFGVPLPLSDSSERGRLAGLRGTSNPKVIPIGLRRRIGALIFFSLCGKTTVSGDETGLFSSDGKETELPRACGERGDRGEGEADFEVRRRIAECFDGDLESDLRNCARVEVELERSRWVGDGR